MGFKEKYYISVSIGSKIFCWPVLETSEPDHKDCSGCYRPGRPPPDFPGGKLKKTILFIILMVLALLLDGTLSYDIFDLRTLSLAGWLGLFLGLIICAVIAWAESPKKTDKQHNAK